jgi:hypothetical protein
MRALIAITLLLGGVSASAAQQGPKSVKTEIVREAAHGAEVLYQVEPDGTVRIDWEVVETLAASKSDQTLLPIAQLMLTIRDRTGKPVGR